MTGLKLQRALELSEVDGRMAAYANKRDVAVVITRDDWDVIGRPTVVTVTVEKIR